MACHRWKRRHFVLTDDLLEYWDRMQGNAPLSVQCVFLVMSSSHLLCTVSSGALYYISAAEDVSKTVLLLCRHV
jgi:hypothetical protein